MSVNPPKCAGSVDRAEDSDRPSVETVVRHEEKRRCPSEAVSPDSPKSCLGLEPCRGDLNTCHLHRCRYRCCRRQLATAGRGREAGNELGCAHPTRRLGARLAAFSTSLDSARNAMLTMVVEGSGLDRDPLGRLSSFRRASGGGLYRRPPSALSVLDRVSGH